MRRQCPDRVLETFHLDATRTKEQTREDYVRQYDRLLHKKAWVTWCHLPAPLKVWIEPQDLYQEACLEAIRCFDAYDPSRASFSTFVYIAVQNRLNSIVGYWTCQKRFPGQMVDLGAVDIETEQRSPEYWDLLVDSVVKMVTEDTFLAEWLLVIKQPT